MTQDRRISHRFTLQIPVTLVLPETGLKVHGKTRDISSSGVFLYANLPVSEHQEVELLMTLPYEFALAPVSVACRATILRVEMNELSGQKGMAATIEKFDFLEAASIPDESLKKILGSV